MALLLAGPAIAVMKLCDIFRFRGKRGGRLFIRRRVTRRSGYANLGRFTDHTNLAVVKPCPINSISSSVINAGLKLCTWNARSIRNKTSVLHDSICDNQFDLVALTETWLTASDLAIKNECTPTGYKLIDSPRFSRSGEGIALVYRSTLSVIEVIAGEKSSFEYAEFIVSNKNFKIRLIIIYRPPPPYSHSHPIIISSFFDELTCYLEPIILSIQPLLIAGDFNIHVDNPNDGDIAKFTDLLESIGLVQHVNTPTHQLGHTLDLIITREADILFTSPPISDTYLSDHCTVVCHLSLPKIPHTVKEISYRKLKGEMQCPKRLCIIH